MRVDCGCDANRVWGTAVSADISRKIAFRGSGSFTAYLSCTERIGELMGMCENPAERAERYIRSFDSALQKNRVLTVVSRTAASIMRVSDALHRYLKDAKHYLENQKPATSLVSIAYAEGLLDAFGVSGTR